jgi:hypothetical protein
MGAEQLYFPGERDRTPAAMLPRSGGDPGDRRFASPVTLEVGRHDARGDRHATATRPPLTAQRAAAADALARRPCPVVVRMLGELP